MATQEEMRLATKSVLQDVLRNQIGYKEQGKQEIPIAENLKASFLGPKLSEIFLNLNDNKRLGYENGTYYLDNGKSGISVTPKNKNLEYHNGDLSLNYDPINKLALMFANKGNNYTISPTTIGVDNNNLSAYYYPKYRYSELFYNNKF